MDTWKVYGRRKVFLASYILFTGMLCLGNSVTALCPSPDRMAWLTSLESVHLGLRAL